MSSFHNSFGSWKSWRAHWTHDPIENDCTALNRWGNVHISALRLERGWLCLKDATYTTVAIPTPVPIKWTPTAPAVAAKGEQPHFWTPRQETLSSHKIKMSYSHSWRFSGQYFLMMSWSCDISHHYSSAFQKRAVLQWWNRCGHFWWLIITCVVIECSVLLLLSLVFLPAISSIVLLSLLVSIEVTYSQKHGVFSQGDMKIWADLNPRTLQHLCNYQLHQGTEENYVG